MFLERSLNDPPPPHFKHLSLLAPLPIHHPSLPKNFDHTQAAPVECEQEFMHCCVAKIAPFQSCSHCAASICITSQLLSFQIPVVHICSDNVPFINKRFHGNFSHDKSVQKEIGSFQNPIRYKTFHYPKRSRAVLLRSKNCSRTSFSNVNRSPILFTFHNAPFHYKQQLRNSTWQSS